jgi:hypothetical protein
VKYIHVGLFRQREDFRKIIYISVFFLAILTFYKGSSHDMQGLAVIQDMNINDFMMQVETLVMQNSVCIKLKLL